MEEENPNVCGFSNRNLDYRGILQLVTCSSPEVALIARQDLDPEVRKTLRRRSGRRDVKFICENHFLEFIAVYEMKMNRCCDPEGRHPLVLLKKDLRKITDKFYKANRHVFENKAAIAPGNKLCSGCRKAIVEKAKIRADERNDNTTEDEDDGEEDKEWDDLEDTSPSKNVSAHNAEKLEALDIDEPPAAGLHLPLVTPVAHFSGVPDDNISIALRPRTICQPLRQQSDLQSESTNSQGSSDYDSPSLWKEEQNKNLESVNKSLAFVSESPVDKRKLTQSKFYPGQKLKKICTNFHSKMEVAAGCEVVKELSPMEENYLAMMEELQKKFEDPDTPKSVKVQILTILPRRMPREKIMQDFGASQHMVRKAKELQATAGILSIPNPKRGKKLPQDVYDAVINFYENDEMSIRSTAGMNQTKAIKIDGKIREKRQKRLVLCGLKELYLEFKKAHPELKIGFSKFAELRPQHCILAGGSGTHNVCVCDKHQNVKLMIDAVGLARLELDGEVLFKTYTDCLNFIVCNEPNEECYTYKCLNCPGIDKMRDKLTELLEGNFIDRVTFNQWLHVDRSNLETLVKTRDEFVDYFCTKLRKLLFHNFVAKKQSEHMQDLKNNLLVGEVLVIADFSENFAFIVQDAIQGFHWNNSQATVHGFVAYYREEEGGELKHANFIALSDYLTHDVTAFYAFQERFIEFLKVVVPNVQTVIYFTDGPASQYKNRFNVSNMCYHLVDFKIKVKWHYHAPAHGKGPVDGLCGGFKRAIGLACLNPKVLITTAEQLFSYCNERWNVSGQQKKITFAYVTSSQIEAVQEKLESRFSSALAIDGIMKMHFVYPLSKTRILAKSFSSAITSKIYEVRHGLHEFQMDEIVPSIFVTVAGEDQWVLAKVVAQDHAALKVKIQTLKPAGPSKNYKETQDTCEVNLSEILTIPTPKRKETVKKKLVSYSLPAADVKKANMQLDFYLENVADQD